MQPVPEEVVSVQPMSKPTDSRDPGEVIRYFTYFDEVQRVQVLSSNNKVNVYTIGCVYKLNSTSICLNGIWHDFGFDGLTIYLVERSLDNKNIIIARNVMAK